MAKLFRFYDPLKEGKGVKKQEPEKKAFFKFFEIYFDAFFRLLKAGILYLIFTITLIPSGLGAVGMAYINRATVLRRHAFIPEDFFDTIKKNWKQALPIGIINLLATAVLLYDIYAFYCGIGQSTFAVIGLGVALFIYIVLCSIKYYVYYLMITFDFKITKLYKTAFHLTFINIWKNLLVELILAVIYAIPVALIYTGIPEQLIIIFTLAIGIFVFPSFKTYLIGFVAFPAIKKYMIDPYYEKNPEKDIEKRIELGILERPENDEEEICIDRG